MSVDPEVLSDIECRDRQILIDIYDKEGSCTMDRSLMDLLDRANNALDKMSDSSKPEKVKVEGIHKTKRNAILLTLNSKEAAIWVREVGNEETFTNTLKGSHIREREYNLIVPRVLLTFDPKKDTDLREIEEANSLTPHIICKAKWIKPVECRHPGQTHAFIILSLTSVNAANKLIRDGISICSSFSRLTKQKQEPIQYMKCRRWGHFADKCTKSVTPAAHVGRSITLIYANPATRCTVSPVQTLHMPAGIDLVWNSSDGARALMNVTQLIVCLSSQWNKIRPSSSGPAESC